MKQRTCNCLAKANHMEVFWVELSKSSGTVTKFDTLLWVILAENVTMYRNHPPSFHLRNGSKWSSTQESNVALRFIYILSNLLKRVCHRKSRSIIGVATSCVCCFDNLCHYLCLCFPIGGSIKKGIVGNSVTSLSTLWWELEQKRFCGCNRLCFLHCLFRCPKRDCKIPHGNGSAS